MIEVKAYQCEYCTKHRKGTGAPVKVSKYRDFVYYHEYRCFYNPTNKTCLTCKNAKYEDGKNYPDCDKYYSAEENGTDSRYFGAQWIRIGCPHWEGME